MQKIFSVFFIILSFAGFSIKGQQPATTDGLIKKEIFSFTGENGLVTTVALLSDKKQMPVLYTAHIITEVCSDGLCKPVNLILYWDLLGNFEDYQTSAGQPLTKFDHIEFNQADHQKLRQILADKSSMIKDYEAKDMVDMKVKVFSNKVDGVTGATSKTFQDVIVSGAAYTVHTLWHIVNGKLSEKMLTYTKRNLNDGLIRQMLAYGSAAYKEFIFNFLSDEQLKKYTNELIKLIGDSDPFVPHFAMSKLPDDSWSNAAQQEAILKYFLLASIEIQNTMLTKFSNKKLSTAGLNLLVDAAPKLNKIQLKKLIVILGFNGFPIPKDLENRLSTLND